MVLRPSSPYGACLIRFSRYFHTSVSFAFSFSIEELNRVAEEYSAVGKCLSMVANGDCIGYGTPIWRQKVFEDHDGR